MGEAAPDPRRHNEHYDLLAPWHIEKVHGQLPPLRPEWVRVRMAYCGLCGSDVSRYTGQRTASFPVSLGHEWVAVVEATGSRLRFLAPGDVVTTDLNFRCGSCRQCASGRSHLCDEGQVGRFTNRGFAIRADIHASYLQKCGRRPAPYLALAEPLSCTMHGLSRCHVSPDDRVLVIGAGGLGVCMSFLLSRMELVESFEVTDLEPNRLDRLGGVVSPRGKAVREPADQYDVVLEVSGTATGLQAACERVSPGGRLCTMSHPPDGTSAEFLVERLLHKDVTVNLSYRNGQSSNLTNSIRLLEQEWTAEWNTLLDVRPFDALPEVIRDHPASSSNKVVIDMGASAATDLI